MAAIAPADYVALHIARRYANPERAAYCYLFRLRPDSPFGPLVPEADTIIKAWVDQGNGLLPTPAEEAVRECRAVVGLKPTMQPTSAQRRQLMARSIQFTVVQHSDDLIEVQLFSRALSFSPKGDRRVAEEWRRTGDGWFSAYRGRDE